VAGEEDLARPREDADARGVRGIVRREHERRLGVVELRCDRLHLLGRQAARVDDDPERVPAKGRSVKTSIVR
jgi:hypothetical protein